MFVGGKGGVKMGVKTTAITPQSIYDIANAFNDYYIDKKKAHEVKLELSKYGDALSAVEKDNSTIIHELNKLIYNTTKDAHATVALPTKPIYSTDGGISRYTPNYIRVHNFQSPRDEFVRFTYDKAFRQFRSPLLIDLRDCPGGSPDLAYFIMSYLTPTGTPLFELQSRDSEPKLFKSASEFPFYTTYNKIHKWNYPINSLHILVNSNTNSAAESLAFTMQRLGAKVYGGTTAGHAHIEQSCVFRDVIAYIPIARTCSPDTHRDWEGVGIKPDYPIGSKEYVDLVYRVLAPNELLPA